MTEGKSMIRRRAIELFQQNITQTEIAARLGVSRVTISQWAKIYKEGGAEALLRRDHRGRSRRLTEDQRREIAAWVVAPPADQGLEARRWTGREVARLIQRRFGISHAPAYCIKLCSGLGVPLGSAYVPPRRSRRLPNGVLGRPVKIAGSAAEKLRGELLMADRGRGPVGWTRRELLDFIRERSAIAYAPRSLFAVLARLGVALTIIPERQRRSETRPRALRPERGRRLTAAQIAELHTLLSSQPDIATWSVEHVRSLISGHFGVAYALSYIPTLLQQLGISIGVPASGMSRRSRKFPLHQTGSGPREVKARRSPPGDT